jgi:hypothetical protein
MKSFYKNLGTVLTILNSSFLYGQNSSELYTMIDYPVVPSKFCDLEEKLSEDSGLLYYDDAVWTFNDSGGLPEIYRVDKETGEVEQTLNLENGANIDWEDIAQDDQFIYVGDFGNNDGNRTDLKIYKISKKDIPGKKKGNVKSEIITFSYSAQNDFTPDHNNHDFDCESVISYGDSLILFSKGWLTNTTHMYKLPKVPGNYKLEPRDSFDVDGLITGADLLESEKTLILIGYKNHQPFIFHFKDFNGFSFNVKKVYRFNFVRMKGSQAEGIAWLTKDSVIFSTEQTKEFKQQVFELNLQTVFNLIGE